MHSMSLVQKAPYAGSCSLLHPHSLHHICFPHSRAFFYLLIFSALPGTVFPFFFAWLHAAVFHDSGYSHWSYNRTFYKWNTIFILSGKIQIKLTQPLCLTSCEGSSFLSDTYDNHCWPIPGCFSLLFPATAEFDDSLILSTTTFVPFSLPHDNPGPFFYSKETNVWRLSLKSQGLSGNWKARVQSLGRRGHALALLNR